MAFLSTLESWFDEHGRTLPWRGIDDPYRIWISEIILQQTRIEQGRDYYLRFIDALPTVTALANASEEQVLRLWQGLGYYSRARNLHAAAQYIKDECNGVFPSSYNGILQLKGVGRYTAAAIASFAFRLPHPVIDGNVYRFISRLRGIATPIGTDSAYNEFEALLLKLIDHDRPDRFNAALMDFGALQCTPHPDCTACPFAGECAAYLTDRVESFPVKALKAKPKDRWFYYLDLRWQGKRIMQLRTNKDIWRGLWEFPLLETDHEITDIDELTARAHRFVEETFDIPPLTFLLSHPYIHQLTHRTIHALFLQADLLDKPAVLPENARLADAGEIKKLPVSRLIDKYLQEV